MEEFYAVTRSLSVYHVVAHGEFSSSATKIASIGKSKAALGSNLGQGGYNMIGIGIGLVSYVPEKYGMTNPLTGFQRDFMQVNTRYWGLQSSEIVALFTDREEALRCLSQENLRTCDKRWRESTVRVIDEIGDQHPSFFVSHYDKWDLLKSESE